MIPVTLVGSLSIASSNDILEARQRIRETAARLGFDHFDQVHLATGVSEIGRELVTAGGGVLELYISSPPPRRLIIRAAGTAIGGDSDDSLPGVVAARRLIGPEYNGELSDGARTFSRLLPKSVSVDDLSQAWTGAVGDPYAELRQQDAGVLELLDHLRRRGDELEDVKRELEETNRGVLALYAELDDKAESVRLMSDERSRFMSDVTHELRTPLSSIVSLCRLLLTRSGASPASEESRQIGYIQKSAQDLLDFVSDLLDLAKFEAGKVELRSTPFEVPDLFGALRGMFRPLSADAGIPLIFETPQVPTVETDENKVTHILRNLISNALKFTEQGEIRISASHEPESDEVIFVVADTGIGIPERDLDRIFDEFVQVESRTLNQARSSGLGLPLSRRLAKLLGGSITVESQVGAGSSFTLRVPRNYSSGPAPLPELGGYVLVVDDDHIGRYVAKEQLERLGWRVVEAADGEMALKLAQEDDCQAIVLDLVMPGLSGFDVLSRLGEDPTTASIPVVIRTSLPASEIDPARVERAAAVFSKSDDNMRAVVDLIAARSAHMDRPSSKSEKS